MTSKTSTCQKMGFRSNVYNLQFPPWIEELVLGSYVFTRCPDYEHQLARLQHLSAFANEFSISACPGQNAVTANVSGPEDEPSAVFPGAAETSGLDDALLLLSLFTRREVFAERPEVEGVIVADPRMHARGGILRCSIPYRAAGPRQLGDVAFAEALNNILELLKDPAWRKQYGNGYFLVLAKCAFKRQPLESSFTQCWTIWEHLFALGNEAWMSGRTIRNVDSSEKIAFILSRSGIIGACDERNHERLRSLAEIRNRLVHAGRFPERDGVFKDAELFCQITEFVIAKVLGLGPSNLFNTVENFERFMERTMKKGRTEPGAVRGEYPGSAPSRKRGLAT